MTVKQFFKSTSFKCIIALLCVLLVSGIFLTVMNSLLAVSDQEKFDRAINKIYGKAVKTETVTVADYNDSATIEEAYKIKDDGNYLVKSTGKGGYDNGTVTCWVVVKVSGGAVSGVNKVVIDSNKGQSYIGNITDKFLGAFPDVYNGEPFSPNDEGFIKTGATRSATAICNAVNGAMDFVNALFGNVAADKYKELGCTFTEYIDTRNSTDVLVTDEDGNVTGVKFTLKTYGYGNAGEFVVNVTVGIDGKISAFEIVTNGSTGGFEGSMDATILDGSWFAGKNIADIQTAFSEGVDYGSIGGGLGSNGLKAGATQSSFLCIYSAAFATANYQKLLPEIEGGDANE